MTQLEKNLETFSQLEKDKLIYGFCYVKIEGEKFIRLDPTTVKINEEKK